MREYHHSPAMAMRLSCVAPPVVEQKGIQQSDKPMPLQLALGRSHLWPNGSTIRIKFLGGTTKMKKTTLRYANKWLHHANLHFKVVKDDADIRIAFTKGKGNWSYLGTECHNIHELEPTMNLDLDDTTPLDLFKAIVLHEFGHALGCIHEHQHPSAGIQWNEDAVLAYYQKEFGWGARIVQSNVFDLYNKDMTQFSAFDKHSIMLYPIMKEHTKDGFSVEGNYDLSEMDKEFIATIYPKKVGHWTFGLACRLYVRRGYHSHSRSDCPRPRVLDLVLLPFNVLKGPLKACSPMVKGPLNGKVEYESV